MKQLDLGKTSTNKIFYTYVIPSIFSMIFATTASFIDSAFVGRFIGGEALAAITLLSPLMMILNGVSVMIAIGGVTYAGICRGREEKQKANNYFNLTMLLTVIVAIAATVIFYLSSRYFNVFFNVEGTTLEYIKSYGLLMSLFFIFHMMNLALTLFLNLDEKPVTVVIINSLTTIINTSLNYLFIVVYQMGIMGAALASGISQVIPTVIFIVITARKSSWKFSLPQIKLRDVGQIFFNGSSELISISSVAFAGVIINRIIQESVGISGVAAYSIAMQLMGLVVSFGFGVSDAIQAAVSLNYGAVKYNRVKSLLLKGLKINVLFGVILMMLSMLFSRQFASLLITDENTITLASRILYFTSFSFIVIGANVVISTYYTSVDSPILSGVISILRAIVFLLIWLFTLPTFFGSDGIWLALTFAEFSTAITAFVIYKICPYGRSKVRNNNSGNVVFREA